MNKEDSFYIKELQPIRGFCLHSDKEDVYKYIYSLQQENQQLKEKVNQLETNWNELKEWLKVCLEESNKVRLYDNNSYQAGETNTLENVIDKVQELERGSSNE